MRLHLLALALSAAVVGASADAVVAQAPATSARGSVASTWAGVALGAYSGSVLGLLGTMMPCNRTLAGGRCVVPGVVAGGVLGAVAGGLLGDGDRTALRGRGHDAVWGTAVGALVGLGVWKGVRQYGWADALASAAVGGAIGATPRGALIGAGIGAATGALAWAVLPRSGFADFTLLTLGGIALGGLVEWGVAAADVSGAEPIPGPSFSIPVGW